MQTLYIKLIPIDEQFIELRYAFEEPAKYETQCVDVSSIDHLIRKVKGSYYMLLPDLKAIGQELFCWLDGSGRWLSRAINDCSEEGLVLALDVQERLRHLPWETLHDGKQFLIDHVNPAIIPIRWLDYPVKDSSQVRQRPLRLLFMATSPERVQPLLDYEQEEAKILEATQDIALDLRVEESGCITELGHLLKRYQEPFDVFHLTGHASIEDEKPVFFTETETGECCITNASDIAKILRFRMPALVFLSGCRTGEAPSDGLVSSLAEELIEQGCRSVIGWGRSISDTTATQAAANLYGKLASGYQLVEALSSTYQYLRELKVEDWHLLRLYIRGRSPQALVEPFGDKVWIPQEPIHEQFLDPEGIVRVATPQEFVGRRRVLQRCLKALRSSNQLGIVTYGMGGIGKSTVAARLLERLQGYDKIFIYKQFDENKLLKQLAEQCLSEVGQAILQGNLPLTQKLTKFLREGLNEPSQRLIFMLDDFEANLEFRSDGNATLKYDVVSVLTSLLKAVNQSQLPHRIIVTSRYDFLLPELNQKLHREQLAALSGADLQKKCSRLLSFSPDLKVDKDLSSKALEVSGGNPRLLEWLDKILQAEDLSQDKILENVRSKSQEFRESILAEEILSRQPKNLQRMLGFCLVYNLPVPQSAIRIICPSSFEIDKYISRSIALGLLEITHDQETNLYYVPRILEPLLKFPEDSDELYDIATKHLDEIWFFSEVLYSENNINSSISNNRLFELYRLASKGKNPSVLTRANWILVMRLNQQARYKEVVMLCQYVMHGALGDFGIQIITPNLLYYLAKAQENLGEPHKALENYQKALELISKLCEEKSDLNLYVYRKMTKASILHDLACFYLNCGDYQEALNYSLQSREIDNDLKIKYSFSDELFEAKHLNQLAEIYQNLGDLDNALNYYQRAFEFSRKTDDMNLNYAIENNILSLQIKTGQINSVDDHPASLYSAGIFSDNIEVRIPSLSNFADRLLKQGRLEESAKIFEQLKSLLPQTQSIQLKAAVLHNLATFYSENGDPELALTYYKKALSIHELSNNQPCQAMTLREIGTLHKRQNNIDDALVSFEEAYQLSLKIGHEENQAYILEKLAEIFLDQEDLENAEAKLNAALAIPSLEKYPEAHALVLGEVGRLQAKRGNFDDAVNYLVKALDESQKTISVTLQASIFRLLGEVLYSINEYREAQTYLQKSLDIYKSINSPKDIELVQDILREVDLVQIYQEAVLNYQKNNVEDSIDLFKRALSLAKVASDKDVIVKILLSIQSLYATVKNYEDSLNAVSQVIDFFNCSDSLTQDIFASQEHNLNYLHDLAVQKVKDQELDEALTISSYCLKVAELFQKDDWTSDILSLHGQIRAQQGNYEEGMRDLNKAISLVKRQYPHKVDGLQQVIAVINEHEAIHKHEQALLAAQNGDGIQAIKLAEAAYKFQRDINCKMIQPATLGLLGQLLHAHGRKKEGLEKLQQALNIADELEDQINITKIQEIISLLALNSEEQTPNR